MSSSNKVEALRSKIAAGGISVGGWVQINSPTVCEIFGKLPFDWVVVDLEHGGAGLSHLPDLFRAISLGGSLPFVRLFDGTERSCRLALDAGALGLVIPNIQREQDVYNIGSFCYYPPSGRRGLGFSRSNDYGLSIPAELGSAIKPVIVGMVESETGVSNLESMLSAKILDAVLVGPYDLSASLGVPGDFLCDIFQTNLSKILLTCRDLRIPVGIHLIRPDVRDLIKYKRDGFTFFPYSMDTVILYHKLIEDFSQINSLG